MRYTLALACFLALLLAGCGSGSSSSPTAQPTSSSAPNVAAMTVDAGPSEQLGGAALNTPFVSVEVCVPGSTTECQTINNIEVDTGSYGLRIISTALSSSLALPAASSGGNPLLECINFADGFVWGPVVTADVYIAGETAHNVPIQIMGGSSYAVPNQCATGTVNNNEDTVQSFGANGALGVGPFAQDCGDACAQSAEPGFYYTCTSTNNCQGTVLALADQVINPVADFSVDNNGVILELPAIGPSGAASAAGSLVFGIDTESNNALGTATVLEGDTSQGNSSTGDITTTYKGQNLDSYIDSGSNIYFFNDSSLDECPTMTDFYCPSSPQDLTATNLGTNGASSTVSFTIESAQTLFSDNDTYTAFDDLAGPAGTGLGDGTFDFGLPFFYGRHIYFAIYGDSTSGGSGPFYAY